MEKRIKSRDEIEDKYKWDLTKLISSREDYNSKLELLESKVVLLESMKGHIMDSSESLYNFYNLYDEFDRLSDIVAIYAKMNLDTNTKDSESQMLNKENENIMEDINKRLSFITPEMMNTSYQKVIDYINSNSNLEKYRFDLEKMYRYQKFTLSESEEQIITKAINVFGNCEDAFYNLDNADINLGFIKDESGNLVQLTNSNYYIFMNSKNRDVRKNAFKSLYNYWESHKNTVASLLRGQIKENFFISDIRKFNSPLEYSLYHDNIDKSVYINLIDAVHENLPQFYKYMELRKKMLNVDDLHMYDIYVDLVDNVNSNIPYEDGKNLVLESLKPLGEEYINDLNKAFKENWIDVYPNLGKMSGAYSWGCYDSYPYILLNYNNTIDAVSTMAHELGHSMHSYYSNKNQISTYAHYPIFLAEIASTVNEVLLNDYMYKNASTKDEKILYLTDFLDKIRTTIYRQTMFAEFELIIHDKEKNGVGLTEKEFSDTYYNLNKMYYGDNVISDEEIKYEWMRIPHFYSSFYVYKYATGLSAALSIAYDILNGNNDVRDKYLEFLKSGKSDYPLNILKRVGVDMMSKEPINKALNMFNDKIKELESII